MPRPRGGDWLEDEIREWRRASVDLVVSLLTPDEVVELDLVAESQLCRVNNIEFVSFPIDDRSIPASNEAAEAMLGKLAENLQRGKNIAIHCRQGIGRAGMMAAGLLAAHGNSPETAIEAVGAARGRSVPETSEQRRWIVDFAAGKAKSLSV